MKPAVKKKLRTGAYLHALAARERAKHSAKQCRDSEAYYNDLDRLDAYVNRCGRGSIGHLWPLQDAARVAYNIARDTNTEYVPVLLHVSKRTLEEHDDEDEEDDVGDQDTWVDHPDTGHAPLDGFLQSPALAMCGIALVLFIIWAATHSR